MELGINNIKNDFTLKVVEYIKKKYGTNPEFLWERTPDCCAFRNSSNKKWFAALMLNLPKSRFGLSEGGRTDVINLKCEPLYISLTVDGKGFFRGYHMNKENWMSVFLDGTVEFDKVCEIIDMSYEIINCKK